MFVLYLLFFNGSAVSERIVSQQTRSDLRELLLDLLLLWDESLEVLRKTKRELSRTEDRLVLVTRVNGA